MTGKSESTALPKSESTKDTKKTNVSPNRTSPSAKRDAQKHSSRTGSPKPVSAKKQHTGRATVQVSLDQVEQDVLDNLRQASSRHDYLQAIVSRHLEAANPVGSFQEDDDLPGNEREVRRPSFRV